MSINNLPFIADLYILSAEECRGFLRFKLRDLSERDSWNIICICMYSFLFGSLKTGVPSSAWLRILLYFLASVERILIRVIHQEEYVP